MAAKPIIDLSSVAYRGFSCPAEPFDHAFFLQLASDYAEGVLSIFIEVFEDTFAAHAGLTAALVKLSQNTANFDALWCAALGNCFRSTQLEDPDLALIASVELLLNAGATGLPLTWHAKLREPRRFRWNEWLLPPADALRVECDEGIRRICLSLDGAITEVVLEQQSMCPTRWSASGASPIKQLPIDQTFISVLAGDTIEPDVAASLGFPPLASVMTSDIETLSRAMDSLRDHLPEYHEWVQRIIRTVILVQCGEQKYLRSGSALHSWGAIYISNHDDPACLAEMLVHEASHNYFQLLTRLGDVADLSNQKLYYSPFVETVRHIDRILLAYHAFANVYLYYRKAQSHVADPESIERRRKTLLRDLTMVDAYLRDNAMDLTNIGRSLAEPLMRELEEEYTRAT